MLLTMIRIFALCAIFPYVRGLVTSNQQVLEHTTSPRKVPVTLGVMSQCPDALYCESVFDEVLKEVGDIVDLRLSFIGRINSTEPEHGVTCRHGPGECTGNIHELCVASLYNSYTQWWPFVICSNGHGRFAVGTEEVSKECAHGLGLSWKKIKNCVDSDGKKGGEALLKKSVSQTRELGIERSCTVIINGHKRCVRDDEEWKECEDGYGVADFVRTIREAHDSLVVAP